MADGSLIFDTKIDSKGFDSGTKSLPDKLGGVNNALKKIAVTAAAAFSVKKLIDFGKQAISIASDVDEVQNVVDTAFGSMAYKMEQFANVAIDSFGMSRLEAKRTGSTLMAMASGMGMASNMASDMAVNLTALSGDMASFYNVSQDIASTALKSVFTGETETLKQFGVVMTEANLQAFALTQGVTKSYQAMSQAEKVQLRYAYVMQQTSLAQGDFAKTSAGWANQTRVMQERFKELLGTLGQGLIKVLSPALQFLNELLAKLGALASKIFGVTQNTEDLASANTDVDQTASAFEDTTEAINDTAAAAEAAKHSLAGFDELNVVSSGSKQTSKDNDNQSGSGDLGLNVKGYDFGSDAAAQIDNTFDKIKDKFKELAKSLNLDEALDNIKKGIDKVNFDRIGDNFKKITKNLAPIAKTALKNVEKVAGAAIGTISTVIGNSIAIAGKNIEIISGGFARFLEQDSEKISVWLDSIGTTISEGFANISSASTTVTDAWLLAAENTQVRTETAISGILSSLSGAGMLIGTVVSDGFAIATGAVDEWCTKNAPLIEETFANVQSNICTAMETASVFIDGVTGKIQTWWDGSGKNLFKGLCDGIMDVVGWLSELYNKWLAPVFTYLGEKLQELWNKHLSKLWDNLLSFFTSIGEAIGWVWNTILSPVVAWIMEYIVPHIRNVCKIIIDVVMGVFGTISDVVGGVIRFFKGLIDFVIGVFTGDWKKAWNGIKDIFGGIWDAIWGIVKGVVNLIIDGINLLWSGIYTAIRAIVNGIGSIAGAIGDLFGKDWRFSMPQDPPKIPRLATGAYIPANYGEFTAILGDNKRAPEIVSPVPAMKQAMREVLAEFNGGNDGDLYLTAECEGDTLFKIMINKYREYAKRNPRIAMDL